MKNYSDFDGPVSNLVLINPTIVNFGTWFRNVAEA